MNKKQKVMIAGVALFAALFLFSGVMLMWQYADGKQSADAFISQCKALALYDTGVDAEYGDKLLTLSTCEYSRNNGRMVVVAKRITPPFTEVGGNA